MPKKDAADACAEVRRPADGERLDVKWSLLEPCGVVGDKSESTETDLAPLTQNSSSHHDEGTRKYCNSYTNH